MVNIIFLGIFDEDLKLSLGSLRLGQKTDLMFISDAEFLDGSLYDKVLENHKLLNFTKKLVQYLSEQSVTQGYDITLRVDIESGYREFLIRCSEDQSYPIVLHISQLPIAECFVSSSENDGCVLSGFLSENLDLDVNIIIGSNVILELS